ncbi:ribulose-phosphate 3-epimerase [uncultured Treponema sp.]|uniref:ribulose-phosphate 3-epimerase n=1 Tax=uncultured Treponema sp. TaxID=162155 RepID=UPI0025E31D9A|nr:ribulose-phosphate 3-epimerase [uncultured Treponema sp.]
MNKISASLMCADLLNMGAQIKELETAGVDYLHLDVMDSVFVPNITLGIDTVNQIKAFTKLPIDIHLLVDKPSRIIRSLNFGSGDFVTIHAECSERIMENVAFIKQKGAAFGLALNPDTTIEEVAKYLPYVDMINIMLIVPGFAGSTLIHGIMEKVKATREFLDEHGYKDIIIEVDGSVSNERASILKNYGSSMFVCGTSSIFKKDIDFKTSVNKFKESVR